MPTIHNASPALFNNSYVAWDEMNWLPSNNSIMVDNGSGQLPTLRPDFDDIVMGLPARFTGFNLEYVRNSSYEFLNGLDRPLEAAMIFESVAQRVAELRPDLDFVFYALPQTMAWAQKDPEAELEATMRRELALWRATRHMKSVAISGYWNPAISFEDWKTRVMLGVTTARTVHKLPVHVFVWDGESAAGDPAFPPLTSGQFGEVLEFLRGLGVNLVYWSHWGERNRLKTVRWSTAWSLQSYA